MYIVDIFIMDLPYPLIKRYETHTIGEARDLAMRLWDDPATQGYMIINPEGVCIDKRGVFK